jgi:alpha-glucosidase
MSSYGDYAIESEVADPESTLNFYKKTLQIRKRHPALGGVSQITFLEAAPGVLAFSRVPGLIAVANTNDHEIQMEVEAESILHQSGHGVSYAADLLDLPAHTTVWLQR